MNTVIFLTKDNKKDMAEAVRLLAHRQITKVNGALIVVHQTVISAKEAHKIVEPLVERFVITSAINTSGNFSLSHDAQIASMFAKFVMIAYSKFPGPWLILDAPSAPLVDNWAQAVHTLHMSKGGKSSGLAKVDGKTFLTHGPIVLQLPWQPMKMFRFSTNESWRSRGRYLIMGSGFAKISAEESVFCRLDQMPQPYPGEVIAAPESTQVVAALPPLMPPDFAKVELDEREALAKYIEELTGKRPHHFTGLDKLRSMAQELHQPA